MKPSLIPFFLSLSAFLGAFFSSLSGEPNSSSKSASDPYVLHLEGKDGTGNGKTVVLVSGDEEYRTEESMPMLAKILAEKHGFTCKVLFSWDESCLLYTSPSPRDS